MEPHEVARIPAGSGNIVFVKEGEKVSVSSRDVKEPCPFCGSEECFWSCDESQAGGFGETSDRDERLLVNAAVTGVESLLLALYCEGIDMNDPRVARAVAASVDAIGNHFG